MQVCAMCYLISRPQPITEIPVWCKGVTLDLVKLNMQREFGGGRVTSENTIIPEPLSKFRGTVKTKESQSIWSGMKRCDSCIGKIMLK